jgi:hypothetical protein
MQLTVIYVIRIRQDSAYHRTSTLLKDDHDNYCVHYRDHNFTTTISASDLDDDDFDQWIKNPTHTLTNIAHRKLYTNVHCTFQPTYKAQM